jgi:methionyl-tRNA synthetase
VIYVRDFLERYQPDALRYFIAAAGPENQDSDFTWAEFVKRTNGELVGGWGNLVNRTATMLHRSFGQIPEPAELTADDLALLATVNDGFVTVGALIERHRQKQALAEVMRVVAEVNKYVTDQAPFKLKTEDERVRLGTILHVLAQAISDCTTLLSPFLPHSSNQVHAAMGGLGVIAPMPSVEEVDDLDGGESYPIITGDYTSTPPWQSRPITVGAPIAKPSPIFTKLDPSVVDEELARLKPEADTE